MCCLCNKSFTIINYDHKGRSKLWRHLFTMPESKFTLLGIARIIIYSFIVLATVITIITYDSIVITIVNYDRKTFIVQDTGVNAIFFFVSGSVQKRLPGKNNQAYFCPIFSDKVK